MQELTNSPILAYFIINEPDSSSQWSNGASNLISWTKGLEDGIDAFDVELARLTDDGLIFVARDGLFSVLIALNTTEESRL